MAARKLLVTGATGKQGGALITALLSSPSASSFQIYGLTRNTTSASARSLAAKGITMIEGDTTSPTPIFSQHPNIWGVFSVTNPGATEEAQAKPLIDAAIAAGVSHFIYTSVDRGGPAKSENHPTNVPHFITKYNVEKYLQERTAQQSGPQKMTWTILRPVAFYDNLTPDFMGKTFTAMLKQMGDTKLQMIGAKDIGKVAAQAFLHYDGPEYKGKAITLAGDNLNFAEMNKIFKEEVGYDMPAVPGFVGSAVKWMVGDLGKMFDWFLREGYGGDVAELRRKYPDLEDFRMWLRKSSKFEVKTKA